MAIVDTGPLVAALSAREPDHAWSVSAFRALPAPLLVCDAVLTEAFHLLERRTSNGRTALSTMLARRALEVVFLVRDDLQSVLSLMTRYSDRPMSLADACLVRMSELHPDHKVLTLDDDFRFYRRFGRRVIPLLIPTAR